MKLRNMTSLYLCGDTGIWCLYRVGSRVADRKYIDSAGGHFEEGELNDPERCVLRELREELADILEVVYALGEDLGYSPAELEKIRREKAEKRGAFREKIFLIGKEG